MKYTKDTIEQANEFIKALTREKTISINFEFTNLCEIIHKAKRLHKLYENACNRELFEKEERETDTLQEKIRALSKDCGFDIKFNGDPRGFPVKIKHPSEVHNTWGGREDGWGVG